MNTKALLLLCALPLVAVAESVVPVDKVKSYVNIRESADATAEVVGRLKQGNSAQLIEGTSKWNEVELPDGTRGFISADWSVVVPDTPEEVASSEVVPDTDDVTDTEETMAADEVVTELTDDPEVEVAVALAEKEESETLDTVVDAVEEAAIAEEAEEAEASAVVAETTGDADAEIAAEVTDETPTSAEGTDAAEEMTELAQSQMQNSDQHALSPDPVKDAEAIETEPAPSKEQQLAASEEAASVDEEIADETLEPEVTADVAVSGGALVGPPGPAGPRGAMGPPGPPGPSGSSGSGSSSVIEGSENFLVKFTSSSIGGSSQIFDDGNKIGIGTTEPQQRLEVNGNIQIHERNSSVAGLIMTQSGGDTGYIMHNRANTLTIGAGSVDRITVDREGNVGFGMTRPEHPIEMQSGAHVTAGGVWTNSSSRAKKENIAQLTPEEALSALSSLEPVHFNYKTDAEEDYIGFIAEDVPDLVATADRTGLSAMDIVAVLTRVVQSQQQKIDELESRLEGIE